MIGAGEDRRTVAEAAMQIARARLAEQHAAVRDLRAHTGALLTATSVVVSFLGTRALTSGHLRVVLAFLGLSAFVASLGMCLYVLLPTGYIRTFGAGSELLSMDLDQTDPASDAYGRLAGTYDRLVEANTPYVKRLGRVFTVASASIVLEVVLWGLQLAIT